MSNSSRVFPESVGTIKLGSLRTERHKFQVVAILGAHTLGKAKLENTGHAGFWTPSEADVFNVTYYENMATKKLKWENTVSGAGPILVMPS